MGWIQRLAMVSLVSSVALLGYSAARAQMLREVASLGGDRAHIQPSGADSGGTEVMSNMPTLPEVWVPPAQAQTPDSGTPPTPHASSQGSPDGPPESVAPDLPPIVPESPQDALPVLPGHDSANAQVYAPSDPSEQAATPGEPGVSGGAHPPA